MGTQKLKENQTTSLRHLLTKKLTLSLFFLIPMVVALFAFSSGFVALDLMEYFFLDKNIPFKPLEREKVQEVLDLINLEVLFFVVLGIFSGLGIAYAISRPLKQIMASTRQIAGGDFSAKLEVERLDELAPVGKDFNFMVSSLNKYLVDSMSGGWLMLDKTGNIVSLNSGATIIFGREAEDFVGKPIGDLLGSLDAAEKLSELIQDSLKTQTMFSGQEIKTLTENDREIHLSLSTTILKDADDHTVGLIANIKDLRRAQIITEQIQRRDKLASLGQMAANLAHEIRNPLGTIRGLTQLLDEEFQEGNRNRDYTRTITREVDRLNQVVSDLLHFAQPPAMDFNFCSINELVEQAWKLTGLEIEKKTVHVIRDFSSDLPPVWAEGRKLVQAFLNILLNASQAVAEPGEIHMSAKHDPDSGTDSHSGQSSGRIIVKIMNDGPPIDPKVLPRIFEPFITTKTKGTGLGLAITQQIIALHGGTIAASRKDGFTVFTIELPAGKRETTPATTAHLGVRANSNP